MKVESAGLARSRRTESGGPLPSFEHERAGEPGEAPPGGADREGEKSGFTDWSRAVAAHEFADDVGSDERLHGLVLVGDGV